MTDHESFEVILMDYGMPEMNGIEAAKLIKRYRKDTQIVIVTGYDFVKEKELDYSSQSHSCFHFIDLWWTTGFRAIQV
jgi:CheY-like chemotaxis protein